MPTLCTHISLEYKVFDSCIGMTCHECHRCTKQFARKQNLIKHLQKKVPCLPETADSRPFICHACGAAFKFESNLSRHKRTCSGPPATIVSLQVEVAQLRQQLQQLHQPQTVVHGNIDNSITNITNTHNTNIHINLNNYGAESQDYLESLTLAQLKKILKLSPDNDSLLNMIRFIHRNKDHPENKTVRLEAVDSDVINVFKDRVWKQEKTDPIIYDIICRSRVRFIDVEPQLSGMAKAKLEALTDYLEKVEDMSNSADMTMYPEYAFVDLITKVKDLML